MAFYLLSLIWEPYKEDVEESRVVVSERSREISTFAWVQKNKVPYDGKLRFSVTFQNRSEQSVSDLRIVDVQLPGFRTVDPCWSGRIPICLEGAGVSGLPKQLAGMNAVTVWAEVEPVERSGRFAPTVVYEWRSPETGMWRDAVALGPIEITAWWREFLTPIGRPMQALIQGLALPLVLFLVSWFFQRQEHKRDDQRKREDQERAERQQVVSSLLPQSLKDTQVYYLPIIASVNRLLRLIKEARIDPAKEREAFYSLVSFLLRMKYMRDNIGGAHFRNQKSEQVASAAWSVFNREVGLPQHLGVNLRDRLLDLIPSSESFPKFSDRFAPGSSFAVREQALLLSAEQVFLGWLRSDLVQWVPVLKLLQVTFRYEVNRPFQTWYEVPIESPLQKLTELEAALPQKKSEEMDDLRQKLRDYIEAFEAESQARPAREEPQPGGKA